MRGEGVRFDTTLTIGLLITVGLETAAALVWFGAAEARLATLESVQSERTEISQRLARLEGETAMMRVQLGRIEGALGED